MKHTRVVWTTILAIATLALSACEDPVGPTPDPTDTTSDVPSSDASLASLSVSGGSLTPAFSSTVFEYATTVGYTSDTVTVSAAATDDAAHVAGTGSVALDVGSNSTTVTVTAEDGSTTATYTISIERGQNAYDVVADGWYVLDYSTAASAYYAGATSNKPFTVDANGITVSGFADTWNVSTYRGNRVLAPAATVDLAQSVIEVRAVSSINNGGQYIAYNPGILFLTDAADLNYEPGYEGWGQFLTVNHTYGGSALIAEDTSIYTRMVRSGSTIVITNATGTWDDEPGSTPIGSASTVAIPEDAVAFRLFFFYGDSYTASPVLTLASCTVTEAP